MAEIAACNAGSLNYLKARSDGTWAWPPMLFDNPVPKVQAFLEAMKANGAEPEFECFDLGIVRSVGLFVDVGLAHNPHYNFVMGVASGMPVDPELLTLLRRYIKPGCRWEVTAIGREEIWPLHQAAADQGGDLRTGLEDTFYLPGGEKAEAEHLPGLAGAGDVASGLAGAGEDRLEQLAVAAAPRSCRPPGGAPRRAGGRPRTA